MAAHIVATNLSDTDRKGLFVASCVALLVTGMTFSIRAELLQPLGVEFGLTNAQLGFVASAAFLGFPLATFFGGPLVDVVGMGKMLKLALLGHVLGILLTIFAGGFYTLFISTLLVGIANGLVEAACNPLVATLYPNDKTKMLNRFHVWFPSGIVIGGLVAIALSNMVVSDESLLWKVQMASMLVPAAIYGFLFIKKSFPATERVASGVSYGDMFKECLRPLFLFMVFCMLLTASTELATGQWVTRLLTNAGASAIVLLCFINGIMAIGRLFAGPLIHRLAPSGVLLGSSILAALGLLWLSYAEGATAFAAAGVFALGIMYFWPTMLGFVSENLPKTGAVGLSVIGGAGMFSVFVVLPIIGLVLDNQIAALIPEGYDLETLQTATEGTQAYDLWQGIGNEVGSTTLRYMALIPTTLIALFTGLFFYQRKNRKDTQLETASAARA